MGQRGIPWRILSASCTQDSAVGKQQRGGVIASVHIFRGHQLPLACSGIPEFGTMNWAAGTDVIEGEPLRISRNSPSATGNQNSAVG